MPRELAIRARAALCAGLLAAALTACKRAELAPPPEMPRAALVLKDGRLFRDAQAAPFTGFVVEQYAGGRLQSRSSVSNGLLQGLSEGFHTNGAVQVRELFVAGLSHGTRTKWFDSGAKQSEAEIVQGRLHGIFRRWNEAGTLVEQIELRAGQPDGVSLAFHPDGSLKARVRMHAGQVLGREDFKPGERREPQAVAAAPK